MSVQTVENAALAAEVNTGTALHFVARNGQERAAAAEHTGCGERRTEEPAAALANAWTEHAGIVRTRCRYWMRNDSDADEAFGRAWLRAVEHLSRSVLNTTSVRSWLLTVADTTCIDLHRERQRRREDSLEELFETEGDGAVEAEPAADDDPEHLLLRKELEAIAGGAIESLPARLRVAIVAFVRTNRHREVACALGITDGNARKRVQEARAILRRQLGEYRGLAGRDISGRGAGCRRGSGGMQL
jgi:RNA polymerase sigma-70 factor (ECF subfamily)